MLTSTREDIQLWTDETGTPARLVWRGERWRVIDRPTENETNGALWATWRFTMRSDVDHRTVVGDVERTAHQWAFIAAYE
ncbi:hypothetical protein [Microbacterium sp. Mcb102]|uniref:hypothetical protein n=1 Tax=Microbacterium sp. Mcb102 TaxID=2926012 RepID=UPI0021C7201F|nr:hypothetical protein [Microbacterium sp. Mcb102]